jgi:hypothetical protein
MHDTGDWDKFDVFGFSRVFALEFALPSTLRYLEGNVVHSAACNELFWTEIVLWVWSFSPTLEHLGIADVNNLNSKEIYYYGISICYSMYV